MTTEDAQPIAVPMSSEDVPMSSGEESMSGRARWQQRYDAALAKGLVRKADFTTLSGVEVDPVYGPSGSDEEVAAALPGFERIGWPGEFPFTRGLHATGYRGRPWTIRQFAGFGNAEQTNERYKMILARGGGGLSVAFDMPTLMGHDSDESLSLGEVGHCGVAIDSAADMETLFDDIRLDEVTTSMTINGPAVVLLALCIVLLGAVIAAYAPSLQSRVKRWPDGPGSSFQLALAVLTELARAHALNVRGLSASELSDTLRIDPLQTEPILGALVAFDWVGRLNELNDPRFVLLCDLSRTRARPLLTQFLIDPATSSRGMWRRAGFDTVTVQELLDP